MLGLVLLLVGLNGISDYFQLNGPPMSELHELKLSFITNVVVEPEAPGSERIERIRLETADGAKVVYRARFPFSSEVRNLDQRYGLLLDRSNTVWGVTAEGAVLERDYFAERNIEAKSAGKFCGGLLVLVGGLLFFPALLAEVQVRTGRIAAAQEIHSVPTSKVVLVGSLLGYLGLFGFIIAPWLRSILPRGLVGLIWVFSAGLLGMAIVGYFKKQSVRK